MTRFSIVIPAYGNAEYLAACLESIQTQTFTDWEAIVVNDASPDQTSYIAHEYADADKRFLVIDKPQNEGRHRARLTGAAAATGDYVLFLDADDQFSNTSLLAELDDALQRDPADILRFALEAHTVNNTDDESARGFESWSNTPQDDAAGQTAVARAFSEDEGYASPWNVTHRAFSLGLIKRALPHMSVERLERAEDAYEYFVLASLAAKEVTRIDILGYQYNMGAGVTNVKDLSVEAYETESRQMKACYTAAAGYAETFSPYSLDAAAKGFKLRLCEAMGNLWYERVPEQDRERAARAFVDIAGAPEADREFYRFVRDRAYQFYNTNTQPAADDELFDLVRIADAAFVDAARDNDAYRRCIAMRNVARGHLHDLKIRRLHDEWAKQRIRIFISTHKDVDLFESNILQPVQVGSARAGSRFPFALHDDEGINISELNPLYCELTTQYWAWKNIDADYLGFCHYRRYFDFSGTPHEENEWGEIIDDYIDEATQAEYGLGDESIRAAVQGFDVITTEFKDLRDFPGDDDTPIKQWEAAPYLIDSDLMNVFAILEQMHPDYAPDIETFATGHTSCFCNMFIMRKQIFDDYCAWLFPILERFCKTCDMTRYSREARRTPGHLSERLFNIYLLHAKRCGASWKTKEVPCVHFEHPERACELEPLPDDVVGSLPVVPVVFAADGNYVPMVTTTIYSMLSNASTDRFYDITIMARGISWDQQQTMRRFIGAFPNAHLRFYDVTRLVASYNLTTNNPHIGAETYYRFLIQDALPFYNKVLYLDSDLIIEGDVAELFDVELGDNLLAAVRDIDYLGNLNMKNGERMSYTYDVLGMDDPYDYFQAGVLLLNTEQLRRTVPAETWLTVSTDEKYIYNDQDILNEYCEGRVVFLEPDWNVMNDCGGRIGNVFSFAPVDVLDAFNDARTHEKVIHYAGFEKPWNTPTCDRREKYWDYARETPFYEDLIARLIEAFAPARDPFDDGHQSALSDDNPLRRALDPVLPLGSRRREAAKAVARAVRGLD